MDLNSQRLTLELSKNLSQSFRQATPLDPMVLFLIWGLFWKILAAQLHHQFQNKSPQCLLQWLENLPIFLGFALEKGEAVATLSR